MKYSEKKPMSPHAQKPSKNSKDIRLTATSKMWSLAIAMLAICIPLSAATKSGPILPLAVVVGTTMGTASVWRGSTKESTSDRLTAEKIKQLEGRIADLETIITSEEINWRHSLEPSSKSTILGKVASSVEEREKLKQIAEARVDPS
ncbi:MAG: hypothetical protein QNJ72_13105 [Pleurocapsa sp. MO_226.B13]|nr:hypothetical protein [Pleurocapsa sp. MO_226.B13]